MAILTASTATRGLPKALALGACRLLPSFDPLRNGDSLLLGDDGDYRVFEDPAGIEILLSEAPMADSVTRESVQVLQSFQHALAGQTVQGPEQEHVKLALAGVPEHGLKLGAVVSLARFMLYVRRQRKNS